MQHCCLLLRYVRSHDVSHALCSRTSSVGVVTGRSRDRGFIPRRVKIRYCFFYPSVQTRSGAHTACCSICSWCSFPAGKAFEDWSWPFTLSAVDVRMRGGGPPLPRLYFVFAFVKRCPYRGLFKMLVAGSNDVCCWGYRCRPVRFVWCSVCTGCVESVRSQS